MARLNTQRMMKVLEKDKARIAAAEAARAEAAKPKEEAIIISTVPQQYEIMTAKQLRDYLFTFAAIVRDANRRFDAAVAAEEHPNSAIQDILHAAELAPSTLDPTETLNKLTGFRRNRRDLKRELEVTEIFKNWATENQTALNKLTQVLGAMDKVLKRQPFDAYRYKTGAVGIQGEFLVVDPLEEDKNENS